MKTQHIEIKFSSKEQMTFILVERFNVKFDEYGSVQRHSTFKMDFFYQKRIKFQTVARSPEASE